MADASSSWLGTAMAVRQGWATLAWLIRTFAKIRIKDWGLEDYAIAAALVSENSPGTTDVKKQILTIWHTQVAAALHAGCISATLAHMCGHVLEDIPTAYKDTMYKVRCQGPSLGIGRRLPCAQTLFVGQLLYVVSMGLTRISASLLVSRVAVAGTAKQVCDELSAVNVFALVASIFVIAFRGEIAQPWTTLDGSKLGMHSAKPRRPHHVIMVLVRPLKRHRNYRPNNRVYHVDVVFPTGLSTANEVRYKCFYPRTIRCTSVVCNIIRIACSRSKSPLLHRLRPVVILRLVYLSPSRKPTPTSVYYPAFSRRYR